ncbi:acyl-CoA-binding domain-containing protein 4-like isoform X2 [Macadamia integrifolia]|nr:acyl-CoA-binding domain-containing protein 4-like isoform X2 [Macadamia integrifolia]
MMGSLGGEAVKKAMWLYPKVLGFNPSERWGHSACYSNGVVYVFGGCCGGLHFSDVLMLDLGTMAWNTLVTTGQQPGTRDSHSAVLVGHRMIVFGGTNGSRKVNDLHILDLRTKEWTRPKCEGVPPSPRESHTATIIDDDKLVIFGGSGEGEGNYLNDLHILDLNVMRWAYPKVNGDLPAPRDSHTAVGINNKLLVYGGDCGDRYHGDVDVLNMDTLTWSKLVVQGSSPGVRAGHASVNFGTKVYVIGGVGDKHYYNDVWVLDVSTCSWSQLDVGGQKPQGRFSHTAVVTNSDIAIYGGCGEDERPLNELIILQLGGEHPYGRYNISLCKIFGNQWNQEKKRFTRGTENKWKNMIVMDKAELNRSPPEAESEPKNSLLSNLDNVHPKRRRTGDSKTRESESEQEEHSLSLSQNSSPSQSDQEQNPVQKLSISAPDAVLVPHSFGLFKQRNQNTSNCQCSNIANNQVDQTNYIKRGPQGLHFMGGEHQRQPKPEAPGQFLHLVHSGREGVHCQAAEQKPLETMHTLIGAEIRGKVDGAFDSGYLMTVNVNGMILRGVLFAPGPGIVSRGSIHPQNPSSLTSPLTLSQPHLNSNFTGPACVRKQPLTFAKPESGHQIRQTQPSPVRVTPSMSKALKHSSDLQGVVLTLGGPGSGHGGT